MIEKRLSKNFKMSKPDKKKPEDHRGKKVENLNLTPVFYQSEVLSCWISALINGKRLVLNSEFMYLGLFLRIGKNTLEIVDKTHHDGCQDYQSNEVWCRHQAVQDICDTPYHF